MAIPNCPQSAAGSCVKQDGISVCSRKIGFAENTGGVHVLANFGLYTTSTCFIELSGAPVSVRDDE